MRNKLSNVPVPALLRGALASAVMAAAWVAPASAAYMLVVDALQYPIGVIADSYAGPFLPPGAIHGLAVATRDSGDAFVDGGGSGPCDFSVAPGCAWELPQARAVGEIRGDSGRLRVLTSAGATTASMTSDAQAIVNANLFDGIIATTAGDLRFDLHFDVDLFTSPAGGGNNSFDLTLRLVTTGRPEIEFAFHTETDGHWAIDKSFVAAGLAAGEGVALEIGITADSECGSIPDVVPECFSYVDASHSAFLGVVGNYASTSGYSYPGFAASVPEPTVSALLTFGLALLGAAGCRARRR